MSYLIRIAYYLLILVTQHHSVLYRLHCSKISNCLFFNCVSVAYGETDNGMDMSDKHPIKTPQELKKNGKKLSRTLFKFAVRFPPLLYK